MKHLSFASLSTVTSILLVALVFSCTAISMGQDAETIRTIFAAAPKTPTHVPGVSIFAAPPKGFNALTASGEELALYGLPQRPDPQTEPQRYARWVRAMTALASPKYHPTDVKQMPWHHSPNKPANRLALGTAQGISNGPTGVESLNWSGVANANKNTKWSDVTSFNFIESFFVVPSAYTPLNACANGITGPFLTAAWNGIDGFSNGDVIQGGVETYSDCGGPADNFYAAWVEWYPSYPELEIVCSISPLVPCPVNPGDTIWVDTYGTAGTASQTVFVENLSQNWSGTFHLAWVSGPGVVGSSEEQIVERPCCVEVSGVYYPYALNNYDYAYFADASGTDGHGTIFYVGEQTTSTYLIDMLDDAGTDVISEPLEQGSSGNAGKYMLWMSDEGCAYTGGCTP
jgi:hypothetical protein